MKHFREIEALETFDYDEIEAIEIGESQAREIECHEFDETDARH